MRLSRARSQLQNIFANYAFVGIVDRRFILLQHLTRLYVVHIGVASQAFMYQQVLRGWGNFAAIRLEQPVPIAELYLYGLAWDPAALPDEGVNKPLEVEQMDGLCYSQRPPHSRLVAIQRTGPAVLLFLPALRALDFFGTGFGDDITCDYFSVVTCGFGVASVWLPSNLVDGDAIY